MLRRPPRSTLFPYTSSSDLSETSGVGTRIATPSSFPLSSGNTRPIAFAAPVDVGIMESPAARARRRSDRKEHTSELQSLTNLVCRLLLEKKKQHARKYPYRS